MIKVLHLYNDALLGRYPKEEIKKQFSALGVDYLFKSDCPEGITSDPNSLTRFCNENAIAWLCWHWESCETIYYKTVHEQQRTFRTLLFGHEQPQALDQLRAHQHYADVVLTSSPIYKNEVSAFFPFGIHTYYFQKHTIPFVEKQNRILISGSYRYSRGQFFEWLLANQPFQWPVYLFPPDLRKNHVQNDRMRVIASRYPKYVYPAPSNHRDYIPEFLDHLNQHKFFLDFTTNTSGKLKFHEDFRFILKECSMLPGGYCPERVLDALWLGTPSWCLYDKAVVYVVGDAVQYYTSLEELVDSVDRAIDNQKQCEQISRAGQEAVKELTTEKIIARLAILFTTGELRGY